MSRLSQFALGKFAGHEEMRAEMADAIAEAIAAERAHFNAALKRIHRMAEIGEPGICAVATEAIRQTESPPKETPK